MTGTPRISTVIRDGERHFLYICPECGAEFLRGYLLVGHLESHDDTPRWSKPCEVCGRIITHPSAYAGHVKGHAEAEKNFWKNVVQDDETGCWEWRASKIKAGYGRFTVCHEHILAHRYAYELLVGPIPEGMTLDHLCRNPGCCYPGHMEVVTNAENVRRGHEAIGTLYCPKCSFSTDHGGALASHLRWKHPGTDYVHNRGSIKGVGFTRGDA